MHSRRSPGVLPSTAERTCMPGSRPDISRCAASLGEYPRSSAVRPEPSDEALRRDDAPPVLPLLQQRVAAAGNAPLVDGAARLDVVTEAIARANHHEPPTEWDREGARVAVRRWQSFGRRHKTDNDEARIQGSRSRPP